jgi:hypothetical protein
MRAITQDADCPSCGGAHHLCLPPAGPIADQYGYTCPATGHEVSISSCAPWKVLPDRPVGALDLAPLRMLRVADRPSPSPVDA